MNDKIIITLDVGKISKSKIVSRSFQTKAGETVKVNELTLEIVPLKEMKILKEGDTYQLIKTHFVAEQSTKEEKAAKLKSKIIGQGVMFRNKEEKKVEDNSISDFPEEVDPNEIPF